MTSALGQAASLAARAGGSVVRQIRAVIGPASTAPAGTADEPASGWLVVTVYRKPADVDTGRLPAALAEFGDRIEVRIRPAADSKGTELGARLRKHLVGRRGEGARA